MAATNRYMNVGPVLWTPVVTGTAVTLSGIKSAQFNDGMETLLESADFDLFHTVGGVTMTAPTITLRSIDAFGISATVGGTSGELDVTFRDFYNGATASGGAKKVALSPSFLGSRSKDAEYRQLATQSITFMGDQHGRCDLSNSDYGSLRTKTVPDAFLVPRHYPPTKEHSERPLAIRREFSKLLDDSKHTWIRDVHLGRDSRVDLITSDLKNAYLFPKGHSLEGQDRFLWTDLPNGIKSGVLLPDPDEDVKKFLLTPTGQTMLADSLNEATAIITEEKTRAQ